MLHQATPRRSFSKSLVTSLTLMLLLGLGLAGAQTLTYVMAYPPVRLDPPNIEDSGSAHIAIHVTEPLVMIGADNTLQPHLATSWTANEDASVWTVELREGVNFTDGTPFNAEAVKFSIERVLDPEVPTSQRGRLAQIAEVTVVDEYTVDIILTEPYSDLPFLLAQTASFIVSPTAARELGEDFGSSPVGTGPFIVDSFVSNESATLHKNPDYWQETGNVEILHVRRVSEYNTRRGMLETGEAQLIQDVLPEDLAALSEVPGVTVVTRSSTRQFMISMNVMQEPLGDVRVRQALNYAVDKEAITEFLFNGTAIVADSPVPSSAAGYTPIGAYPYDPERARELLAEAGYPDGFEINLWGPTPGRLLMGTETTEQVQADLANIGVRATITQNDGAANIEMITLPPEESLQAGKGLMYLGGPAARGIQAFFNDFFHTDSWAPNAANRNFYSNPRVDELIDEAGRTGDPERKQELYDELQAILMEDAPWIYLFTISLLWAHDSDVTGLEFLPNDLVLLTRASIQ